MPTLTPVLQQVRHDLLGFLDAAGVWGRDVVPGRADQLVAAVDRGLSVSAPLS